MRRKLPVFIILFISTSALFAVDHFIMEVESGVTWLHNEAYGTEGSGHKDPDPILYRIGLAFPIYLNDSLFIRPSLTVISKSWQYIPDNNWAMPVDPMWQDLMVMSLLFDFPVGYELKFSSFSFGFFGGPAFNFRTPLWGEGESVREDMVQYFFSSVRFINLTGGFFFNIPLSDIISLTLKGDSWIPIHNLWSRTGLPFSDGLMVTVSAGIRFTF